MANKFELTDLRAWALNQLDDQSSLITQDPQTNSIAALGHQIFARLDAGELEIGALRTLASSLHGDILADRMEAFHASHSKQVPQDAWQMTRTRLEALAKGPFETFADTVSRVSGGIVFTAHPTFAMPDELWSAAERHATDASAATRKALLAAATSLPGQSREAISLPQEHEHTQTAITHARNAINEFQAVVFEVAKQAYPDRWQALRPHGLTVASWVGYDLDGRTDIHWSQSFAFRLQEKSTALATISESVSALGRTVSKDVGAGLITLSAELAAASSATKDAREFFIKDLTENDNLVPAANALTEGPSSKLISAQDIASRIRDMAAQTDDDAAKKLHQLAAQIETVSLGTAHIHLRLNAAQIRTVIRRDLGLETEDRQLGRLALAQLTDKVANTKIRPTNFADLFLEQSTARRQFMMCAQILKHIDAESPIRFLIAESENPATLMGALYLAKQYGVDHKLDLSPLFETPEALERGGRFIERLLDEPAFAAYVEQRGRLSIQLGFSDSGRFIGQVAAQMAIERIHSLIGRALSDRGIKAALLIFNTHGESIGRGAYPGTLAERFDHLLTPWVRARFDETNVKVIHEVSFQGGDGFLHFANPNLARATVSAFCEHILAPIETEDDPFYSRTDFTWDIYRSLRTWHERFFENPDYHRILYAFAPQFLLNAGSRQRRRAGGAETGVPSPRALRAIPQNAMMHQLAIPLNTVSAIGSSVNQEMDRFVDLARSSKRLHGLLLMAIKARMLTSLPALRAYARAYDPGYWTALSKYGGADAPRAAAHQRLGRYFGGYITHSAIHRIANFLTVDLQRFDRIIDQLDNTPSTEDRHHDRLPLHVLHAIRIALMMHAFSLVAQVPAFSPGHGTTRTELLRLVTGWQVDEVVDRLCAVFPASPGNDCLTDALVEQGHNDCDDELGYDTLHKDIIAPLKEIAQLNETLTLAISHKYGAYG